MVTILIILPNLSSSSSSLRQPLKHPSTKIQSSSVFPFSFPHHNSSKTITFSTPSNSIQTPFLVSHCSSNGISHVLSQMGLFSLLQEIGLNEKETQLIFDKNPSLASASFDSVQNRIISLQSLRISGFMLARLIAKRPDTLTSKEIDSLTRFFNDDLEAKIEPKQLYRLLNATEPRFFVGFERKVRLLLHQGIPQAKLAYVLNNVNLTKAFCLKSVEEIENAFVFLNRFTSGAHIITRRPSILNYDLEAQIIPRVGFLLELSGGDEKATGLVLSKLPAVLTYSVEHVRNHVEFLRSFAGLDDPQIFKILLVYPNVFSASKTRKLQPRIDFLKQCGFDSGDIFKFFIKAPLFLGLSFDNLACKLAFLVKIGYVYRTRELAFAVGAVTRTSCENLQKVIGLYLSYGLSCGDIVTMSKKHPQILQYGHGSLEEKMDYLIEEMGREIGELLSFPAFLGYKLCGRIKHRYEVKKDIVGEKMSLNKLLSVSAERFLQKKKSLV